MPSRINLKESIEHINELSQIPKDPIEIERSFKKQREALSRMVDCKVYSVKHSRYDNVHLLNGYEPRKYLYKYVRYSSFIDSVRSHRLVFVSPNLWQDPWECVYYETDYCSYNYIRPQIACLCTTENATENEYAAWKLYVNNPQDKSLRISLNVDNLLFQLNDYAINNHCQVYIGKMIYEFERGEIQQLHTDNNKFFKDQFFFSPFTDINYLSLMCLKRKAFKYENEVRIFIVKQNALYENNNNIISVTVDFSKVVKKIVIAPLHPYEYGDPRRNRYTDFAKIEHEALKESIKEVICSASVYRSILYESKKIDKVLK